MKHTGSGGGRGGHSGYGSVGGGGLFWSAGGSSQNGYGLSTQLWLLVAAEVAVVHLKVW